MSKIIRLSDAGEKFPKCRLCGDMYEKRLDLARGVFVYSCQRDDYSIRCDDPMLVVVPGRGDAMDRAEAILRESEDGKELFDCPYCRATMKFVCTSTGYMLFLCVKTARRGCGMRVEHKEPDRATLTEIGQGVKNFIIGDDGEPVS